MTVLLLCIARQRETPAEEGEVPQVGEDHAGSRVHAEDLDARERSDDPDPEAEHVGDRGDGDGHSRVSVAVTHPGRNIVVHRGSPPGG